MKSLIKALEELVKESTDYRGKAIVIMYDEEDGYWLSTVDCGCHHHPVLQIDDERFDNLSDAIKGAVEYHNNEVEKINERNGDNLFKQIKL